MLSLIAPSLLVPLLLAGPALAQDAPKKAPKAAAAPAATGAPKVAVNGVMIPQSYFDALTKQAAAGGRSGPEVTGMIKEELVNREVLFQAAKKRGLDKNADVVAEMDLARQGILIQKFFEDYVKANPVSDADLKAQYDSLKAQMGDTEYKVRHILVEKEDEAKTIIESLRKGGDFNALAKDKSKDPGSKDNGGDLDWGPAARYVKPFADSVKALSKGQTTDKPVQTQFGWHIIRLEDTRPTKIPAFDEVKPQFAQRAQQEQIQKLVADLRGKAKVEDK
ncbi:MAG: peptidylprolyl isomerase [Betaproteobacteria bacterium]|nr:peptidylprolyl isomerase [Betaproteobacteria bacterium]